MKKLIYISFSFLGIYTNAQTALYNTGNLQIHQNGQIGFHTHLINDGSFDENTGLVGFYGNDIISVSGAFKPIFYDTEIANPIGVLLNTPISNTNNINFIIGDIITHRTQRDVYYNFLADAWYLGESNSSKIDGFIQINNKQRFTFPVGDSEQIKPLTINSETANTLARCAYFFNTPNHFDDLNTSASINIQPVTVEKISALEFWILESTIPSTVTISWNNKSDISSLTDDVNTIIITGWHKIKKQWVSLGNIASGGNLNQGFVTSESFIPNEYELITFGTATTAKELLYLENYLITPNGDGINEFLFIPELEQSTNNTIKIYDRFGLKVFEQKNYTNQFNGFINTKNNVFNKEKKLPTGIYFYIASMHDLKKTFQGYLYLTQ